MVILTYSYAFGERLPGAAPGGLTRGYTLALSDVTNAALAISRKLALVTRNVTHYPFPGLKLSGGSSTDPGRFLRKTVMQRDVLSERFEALFGKISVTGKYFLDLHYVGIGRGKDPKREAVELFW